MKQTHIIWNMLLGLLFLTACQKEEIMQYEEAPGVYFNSSRTTYNFIENAANLKLGCDTINVPVLITGTAVDYDRPVAMTETTDDTLFTAEKHMYRILGGNVPANEYAGQVQVEIHYSQELDDSVYVARFLILSNEHFPVVDLNGSAFSLSITNKFTEPANWGRLRGFFGNYSNSWYTFILEVTGLSSIPYWSPNGSADPNNPDPERWTMTYTELSAYAAKVKVALAEYNNDHPGNPLKHEDGKYKGQVISMK